MASVSPMALSGASDLLQNSTSGLFGSRTPIVGVSDSQRDVRVMAKIRKAKKKKERPWLANPDPNAKGGVGIYLSSFKPLKDKPMHAILAFKKPLADLKKKIKDVSFVEFAPPF